MPTSLTEPPISPGRTSRALTCPLRSFFVTTRRGYEPHDHISLPPPTSRQGQPGCGGAWLENPPVAES